MKQERVTNEQAIKDAKYLLDARAERDRAIEIIREMREGLEIGLDALQAQGWTRHRDDEIALIESLLEKSKDDEEGNGRTEIEAQKDE